MPVMDPMLELFELRDLEHRVRSQREKGNTPNGADPVAASLGRLTMLRGEDKGRGEAVDMVDWRARARRAEFELAKMEEAAVGVAGNGPEEREVVGADAVFALMMARPGIECLAIYSREGTYARARRALHDISESWPAGMKFDASLRALRVNGSKLRFVTLARGGARGCQVSDRGVLWLLDGERLGDVDVALAFGAPEGKVIVWGDA